MIMASNILRNVKRTRKLAQDRLITLLDKQGREIHDQDKSRERIEEFHTDPKAVPDIISWEVEAALRDMKNGTATRYDHINIETLKAGENTISKILAKCTLNAYQKDEYPQRDGDNQRW